MKKLGYIICMMLILSFFAFADDEVITNSDSIDDGVEAVESEDSSYEFFAEAEDVAESAVANGKFDGLENEITAVAGLSSYITETFYIGGAIENYSDILTDALGASALAESETALGFFLGTEKYDMACFEFGTNLVFNFRPDDLLRVGAGYAFALSGVIEDAFFEYGIENSANFISGKPSKGSDFLLATTTAYSLRFDFLNFIKDDINLGLFAEGEFESENLYTDKKEASFCLENEMFAGLVYSPVDVFECSFAFAMYNVNEDGDKVNEFGLRTGLAYSGDNFSIGFNYIPHLLVKENGKKADRVHAFEVAASISL